VIRRDYRVEFAAHRAHENRVGRKWPEDQGLPRGGSQNVLILRPETAIVAGVRIQRAQRDPRRGNPEPVGESAAGDISGLTDCAGRHRRRDFA